MPKEIVTYLLSQSGMQLARVGAESNGAVRGPQSNQLKPSLMWKNAIVNSLETKIRTEQEAGR